MKSAKANFAVLSYRPYSNRTEHMNYGVVVFSEDRGTSIHLIRTLKKLRCISPDVDISRIKSDAQDLENSVRNMPARNAIPLLKSLRLLGESIDADNLGAFLYDPNKDSDFLDMVNLCLQSQCLPKSQSIDQIYSLLKEEKVKLNQEVKRQFTQLQMLAHEGEFPDHVVVPNYKIAPESDLMVEFAIRNGRMNIAQTMDLRKDRNDDISNYQRLEANSKILSVLYAKEKIEEVRIYLIVAGSESNDAHRIIDPFIDRVDRIMRWEDRQERTEFFTDWLQAAGRQPPALPPMG